MYRDQKKRKEGGTRKGAREQALAHKEWSPPPPHRRRPAPSNTTAQHSCTHDGPTRPSAGAQMPDPHGVHERWCWCHGQSSHRQNIQTDRDRDEMRDSTKRGVGKRGAGPQKPRSRAAAMAARTQSLVLTDESQVGPDGRITKFDSV